MSNRPPSSNAQRILLWSMIVCMVGSLPQIAWITLPHIAPQFVIQHSPWIDWALRAEAYETEGIEPDLTSTVSIPERHSLINRILAEEGWEDAAKSIMITTLSHRNLMMRRTAASILIDLRHSNSTFDQQTINVLIQLLNDDDDIIFNRAYSLLLLAGENIPPNPEMSQALLVNLPRMCELTKVRKNNNFLFSIFSDFYDENEKTLEYHELSVLRHVDIVTHIEPWLTSSDVRYQQLACLVLRFSDDPRALELLSAHLGHFLNAEEFACYDDPVAFGLGRNSQPQALTVILNALKDSSVDRRRSAVRAVMCHDIGDNITQPLLQHMREIINDPDPIVRKLVAQCLSGYPLNETLDDLTSIIKSGGEPAISAIKTIYSYRISLHRSRPWWGRPDVIFPKRDTPENLTLETQVFDRLRTLISHPEPEVRYELARYLAQTWEPETELVLRSLTNDPDLKVRAEVKAELRAIEGRTRRIYGEPLADD
jgi:HEAT repeat protein